MINAMCELTRDGYQYLFVVLKSGWGTDVKKRNGFIGPLRLLYRFRGVYLVLLMKIHDEEIYNQLLQY